jgi:hypothetical protein
MERASRRTHLKLVSRSEEEEFELEVAEVLRRISPEGRPASPAAQRRSLALLLAVIVLEAIAVTIFGWYYAGPSGAVVGLIALFCMGIMRAGPILIAASARRRDRQRAEAIVRQQRAWRRKDRSE